MPEIFFFRLTARYLTFSFPDKAILFVAASVVVITIIVAIVGVTKLIFHKFDFDVDDKMSGHSRPIAPNRNRPLTILPDDPEDIDRIFDDPIAEEKSNKSLKEKILCCSTKVSKNTNI